MRLLLLLLAFWRRCCCCWSILNIGHGGALTGLEMLIFVVVLLLLLFSLLLIGLLACPKPVCSPLFLMLLHLGFSVLTVCLDIFCFVFPSERVAVFSMFLVDTLLNNHTTLIVDFPFRFETYYCSYCLLSLTLLSFFFGFSVNCCCCSFFESVTLILYFVFSLSRGLHDFCASASCGCLKNSH